jgi:hypothetical protein
MGSWSDLQVETMLMIMDMWRWGLVDDITPSALWDFYSWMVLNHMKIWLRVGLGRRDQVSLPDYWRVLASFPIITLI